MFYLACTRFNNESYQENMNYRKKHNEPAIYSPMVKIREIYPPECFMFVVEMNNDENRVEGIGLIRNSLIYDKKYKIYNNSACNYYIYKGRHWTSRESINNFNPEILRIFDLILFKGKSNLKRRIGITVITDKLFKRWNFEMGWMIRELKLLFRQCFMQMRIIDECKENKEK